MWQTLTHGNGYWCDEATVQNLQGLSPKWSLNDRVRINSLFVSGKLFARASTSMRGDSLQYLLSMKLPVLSFATFFKHTKWLGSATQSIRALFPEDTMRPTVRTVLMNAYVERSTCVVQYKESETSRLTIPGSVGAKWAYCQLWLSAIRHRGKKEHIQRRRAGRTQAATEQHGWLVRLACDADELGYSSSTISELKSLSSDLCDIRAHMFSERPTTQYNVSLLNFELEAKRRLDQHAIFEPFSSLSVPRISSPLEGKQDTVNDRQLFIGLLWEAFEQEPEAFLTAYGKFVLAFTAFFDVHEKPIEATIAAPDSDVDLYDNSQSCHDSCASESLTAVDASGKVRKPSHDIYFYRIDLGRPSVSTFSCSRTVQDLRKLIKVIEKDGKKSFFIPSHGGYLRKIWPTYLLKISSPIKVYYSDASRETGVIGKSLKWLYSASREGE